MSRSSKTFIPRKQFLLYFFVSFSENFEEPKVFLCTKCFAVRFLPFWYFSYQILPNARWFVTIWLDARNGLPLRHSGDSVERLHTDNSKFGCEPVKRSIWEQLAETTFLKRWRNPISHCLKITQNVVLEFLNFGIFQIDLSGNTVWPQASGFQKLAKIDHFGILKLTFVHSKCKRSSLRSQCWTRLFLWFSNTVL